jgi:hypothetical protein
VFEIDDQDEMYRFRVILESEYETTTDYNPEQIIYWYTPFITRIAKSDGNRLIRMNHVDGANFEIELEHPVDKYTLGLMVNPDPEWNFPVEYDWHAYGVIDAKTLPKNDLYDLFLEEESVRVRMSLKIRESQLYKKIVSDLESLPLTKDVAEGMAYDEAYRMFHSRYFTSQYSFQ